MLVGSFSTFGSGAPFRPPQHTPTRNKPTIRSRKHRRFPVIQSLTLCRVNQGAKHCQDKRKSLFFTAISTCTTHSQVPPAAPLSLTAPVRLFKIVLLPVLTSLPQTLLGQLILCLVFVDINRSRHLCGA